VEASPPNNELQRTWPEWSLAAELSVRQTLAMPHPLAATIVATFPLLMAAGGTGPRIPEAKPWIILVHDSGLSARRDAGLVFALWKDGTLIREQAPLSGSSDKMLIGRIDPNATKSIDEAITSAGLWNRTSAPRYLDLPEDGLLIRSGATTKCWFDTPPTAVTPGLRTVADASLRLQLRDSAPVTIVDDVWLRWSHSREAACQ
jgi:hypothetical protein